MAAGLMLVVDGHPSNFHCIWKAIFINTLLSEYYMDPQRCSHCKEIKPLIDYNWKNKANNKRKDYCRVCDRQIKKNFYYRNKARIIESVTSRKRANIAKFNEWKQTLKCIKCGESDDVCLDFHHLDPSKKEATVSTFVGCGMLKQAMEEATKCIVVCSNCHRKIHKYGLEMLQNMQG